MNQCQLVETKRSSVEERLSLIHLCLFSSQTCLYKVEQSLLTDAARPGSVTAGRLLTCGALIWRIPVEMVPLHQEASVSSTNMLKNQPFYFQTPVSSLLSCVRRLFLSSRGLSTSFIRLHFLSVASQNPAIVIVIISYWVKC